MIKRISLFLVAAAAAVVISGCSGSDGADPNIPVGKPGDGGPQPTRVQTAGGGTESGTTQTPATE